LYFTKEDGKGTACLVLP